MKRGNPGSKDAVYHTLKHFLCEGERWGELPPAEAQTPLPYLAQALERGWREGIRAFDSDHPDETWWSGAKSAFVLDAHGRGYRPRYDAMVARAGYPCMQNRWTSVGEMVWLHRAGEFDVVVATLRVGVQVVTAYRRGYAEQPGTLRTGLAGPIRAWVVRNPARGGSGDGGGVPP